MSANDADSVLDLSLSGRYHDKEIMNHGSIPPDKSINVEFSERSQEDHDKEIMNHGSIPSDKSINMELSERSQEDHDKEVMNHGSIPPDKSINMELSERSQVDHDKEVMNHGSILPDKSINMELSERSQEDHDKEVMNHGSIPPDKSINMELSERSQEDEIRSDYAASAGSGESSTDMEWDVSRETNQLAQVLIESEASEFQHHIKEEIVDDYIHGSVESDFMMENAEMPKSPNENGVCDADDVNSNNIKIEDAGIVPQQRSRIVYRCKYCGQQLQKISSLQKHENAHRDGSIYKCRYCEYYSLQRDRIEAHERKHTGEKPFGCDKCEFRCSCQGDLKKHDRIHFSARKFKCPLCPFRSKWSGGITKHLQSHSKDRPFSCNICGDSFKAKYVLENHMKLHSSVKNFFCDMCDYSCKTRNLLKLHVKTHSDVRNFACTHPGCPQRCKTKSDLVKHMSVHATTFDFKCVLCHKKFKSKQSLRSHTRRHEIREYPCKICGKILCSKNSLHTHLSIHTGKKHSCPICDHKFSTTHNLKVHLKVHEESRAFRCPLCEYSFENVNHLFTHIGVVHGKDYVYFCEICRRPFSRYMMMKFHIDRYHREGDNAADPEFIYNNQCQTSENGCVEEKFTPLEESNEESVYMDLDKSMEDSKPISPENVSNPCDRIDKSADKTNALSSSDVHNSPSNNESLCNGIDENENCVEEKEVCIGKNHGNAERNREDLEANNSPSISHENGCDVYEGQIKSEINSEDCRPNSLSVSHDVEGCDNEKQDETEGKSRDFEPNPASTPQSDIADASVNSPNCNNLFSLENVVVDNCSTDDKQLIGLGNKELTIKLERLPDNFEFWKGLLPASEKPGLDPSHNSKIIKLGTYANVWVHLVGKNSGVKFTLKRGKKSSKWFMDPSNMTPDAAEKTRKYLTKQASFSQRKNSSKRTRRKLTAKTKEDSPEKQPNSALTPKVKSPRKKKLLGAKKKNTPTTNEVTFPKDVNIKSEVQVNLCQISNENNVDCCLEESGENHVSLLGPQSQPEMKDASLGKRKKKRKTATKQCRTKSVNSKKGLKGRKSKKSKTETFDICESQKVEYSKEQEVKGNLFEDASENSGQQLNQDESASVQQSSVLGVVEIIDSPFQITWKKVGGSNTKNGQKKTDPTSCSELGQEDIVESGRNIDEISPNGCSENPLTGDEESVIDFKDQEDDRTKDVLPNNETCSLEEINDTKIDPETHNDKLKYESSHFVQDELIKTGVKVLSLKEFEDEYRKRPKIVANISYTDKVTGKRGGKTVSKKRNKIRKKPLDGTHEEKLTVYNSEGGDKNVDCNENSEIYENGEFSSQVISDNSGLDFNQKSKISVPKTQNCSIQCVDINNDNQKQKLKSKKRIKKCEKKITQLVGAESTDDKNVKTIQNHTSSEAFENGLSKVHSKKKKKGAASKVLKSRKKLKSGCKLKVSALLGTVQIEKTSHDDQASKSGKKKICNRKKMSSQVLEHDVPLIDSVARCLVSDSSHVAEKTFSGETSREMTKVKQSVIKLSELTETPVVSNDALQASKSDLVTHSTMSTPKTLFRKKTKKSKALPLQNGVEDSIPLIHKDQPPKKRPGKRGGLKISKQPPCKRRKKVSDIGQSSICPGALKPRKTGVNVRDEESIIGSCSPANNHFSAMKNRIKLPGLMTSDLIEKRLTVECVTMSPKVLLRDISAVSSFNFYNPHLCIPHQNNKQIVIDVHPPFDPVTIESFGAQDREDDSVKMETEPECPDSVQEEFSGERVDPFLPSLIGFDDSWNLNHSEMNQCCVDNIKDETNRPYEQDAPYDLSITANENVCFDLPNSVAICEGKVSDDDHVPVELTDESDRLDIQNHLSDQ